MPNHRNVYISLATSMSKTGKFQLTPLVCTISDRWYEPEFACVECLSKFKKWKSKSCHKVRISFSAPLIWFHLDQVQGNDMQYQMRTSMILQVSWVRELFKSDEEDDKLVYYSDVSKLFDLLDYDHVSNEWRLFIDGSCMKRYYMILICRQLKVHHFPTFFWKAVVNFKDPCRTWDSETCARWRIREQDECSGKTSMGEFHVTVWEVIWNQ